MGLAVTPVKTGVHLRFRAKMKTDSPTAAGENDRT